MGQFLDRVGLETTKNALLLPEGQLSLLRESKDEFAPSSRKQK